MSDLERLIADLGLRLSPEDPDRAVAGAADHRAAAARTGAQAMELTIAEAAVALRAGRTTALELTAAALAASPAIRRCRCPAAWLTTCRPGCN